MAINPSQTAELSIFRTKPIGPDGNFVLGWQQFIQSLVQAQTAAPKAYTLTHAQRLALQTANVTAGSLAFETDTNHLYAWFNKWVQLV